MTKVGTLKVVRDQLRAVDNGDARLFTTLVRDGLDALVMSDGEFAEKVNVSRPTVSRWKAGETVPHRALRPTIYTILAAEIERTLRPIEADERDTEARSRPRASSYPMGEALAAKSYR
jgi:hypothetical protein